METKEPNNLPIKTNPRALFDNNKPAIGKMMDSLRRTGAIMGSSITMVLGLGMAAVPIPLANVAGWGVFAAGLTNFTENVTLKTEPTLLFGSKKQGDEIGIYQNLFNFTDSTRMAGYDSLEKMSMMGLQTLVGFSRYKQNLKDTPSELSEDGQTRIYTQKFATLTHGINLENLKALETLGYIKIDSMSSQFEPKSLDEKIAALTAKKGEPKRSYLLMEKIGFGNWKGAGDALKAMVFGDKKQKEHNSVEMQKISFRLTDKPIDFEEIKKFRNPQYRKSLPPELARAAGKIGMMARLMENRQLEVTQDAFGRDIIKYPSRSENSKINQRRENARKEREQRKVAGASKEKFEEQQKEFDARVKEGVKSEGKIDVEQIPDKSEHQANKENIQEI